MKNSVGSLCILHLGGGISRHLSHQTCLVLGGNYCTTDTSSELEVSKATGVRLSSTAPPASEVIFASSSQCRHPSSFPLPLLSRPTTKKMVHFGARQTGSVFSMSPRDSPSPVETVAGEFGTCWENSASEIQRRARLNRAKFGGWAPIGWDRAGTCIKWSKENANAGTMETVRTDRNGTTDSPSSRLCFRRGTCQALAHRLGFSEID